MYGYLLKMNILVIRDEPNFRSQAFSVLKLSLEGLETCSETQMIPFPHSFNHIYYSFQQVMLWHHFFKRKRVCFLWWLKYLPMVPHTKLIRWRHTVRSSSCSENDDSWLPPLWRRELLAHISAGPEILSKMGSTCRKTTFSAMGLPFSAQLYSAYGHNLILLYQIMKGILKKMFWHLKK